MHSFSLIPRVRVNYSLLDLCKSVFVSEKNDTEREKCISMLMDYYDGRYVCLTPSGRDAIYEVLIRLPQKRVIVPAYTCMAVIEAVQLAEKEIVFCDSDTTTYNSNYIEQISSDCIVLATHQYGLPCNIQEIAEKCKEQGAILIEDCATSMGTTVDGKKTGTFGDFAIVSFNASKMLNVPPVGGVLIGKNKEIIDSIKQEADWINSDFKFKCKSLIRGLVFVLTKNRFIYKLFHYIAIDSKGKLQLTEHEKPAEEKTDLYKYRFAEWQASILLKQLKKLDTIMDKRKELFAYYEKNIINPLIKKPILDDSAVCCRYAIQVEQRNDFYHQCVKHGVDLDFSHCSLGCPPAYSKEHQIAKDILNVPFYSEISIKEMDKVVSVINSIR